MNKKIIFATKNKGKLKEVEALINNPDVELLSLLDFPEIPDVVEDGLTFEANSKKKATAIFKEGYAVISDDSGLAVEQLNGEPGVFSARYAGEDCSYDDNNRKLLSELKKFNPPHKAKFVCYACYYDGKETITAVGELKGEITHTSKGTMGFGYDPIFIPEGYDRTLAELSMEEKNKLSHRAKAFKELFSKIK